MDELLDIRASMDRLDSYVKSMGFAGFDPYDALTGRIDFTRFGKWAPILAIQFMKRCPVNVRPALGIPRQVNPKSLGLLLEAYSRRAALGHPGSLATANELFTMLLRRRSKGYTAFCWGYPFDWASPAKFLPAGTPSAVVTAFVGRGLHSFYRVTGDPRAAEALAGAARFIMNDLPRIDSEDGLCFSYTPMARDCCYNANLLAAELLARTYSVTADEDLRIAAERAAEFVVRHQHEDGHWNYSRDLESGQERRQIDFHQGFVLDSLWAISRYAAPARNDFEAAIRRGAAFYREHQFEDDGRALYRLPFRRPADIHHQAQGILTFSRLAGFDPEYARFAENIARWTIRHMQDAGGFFYYRKGRFLTNKIAFMRWGQAWMMLALTALVGMRRGHDEVPVLHGTSGTFPSSKERHPVTPGVG